MYISKRAILNKEEKSYCKVKNNMHTGQILHGG